ncbi:hypothetical protein COR50_06360 [Chitinophaga caeni]|uniref:Uncharacterized protein n=1 Tax=Chitinophaga caeni TaxID=2029983 RepID=A0A291QSH5_9BACT|nr:ABC transporter permease [Chitinophaga caeni]ATL46832.1 hypothetical protein COR50_06360 [Chitinophaga caeni]
MFLNYIKIAWRNIWKSKVITGINVFGLSVAIGAALLLGLTASWEFSFDNFHPNEKDLYQIYFRNYGANGEVEERSNMTIPLVPALLNECPSVLNACRIISGPGQLKYKDKTFGAYSRCADPGILKMFNFPVIEGNKTNPLGELNNAVMTETAAKKYFKEEDPIGKTIELKSLDGWDNYVVTAILKDIPENSSIDFEILTRFEKSYGYEDSKDNWHNSSHEQFVQLRPGTNPATFESQAINVLNKYYAEDIEQAKKDGINPGPGGNYKEIKTIPINEIHFSGITRTGSSIKKSIPVLLIVITIFLLLIACINFINLSVGRSFTRAKEIGMRKMLGAFKRQLFFQLWGEAFFVCFISLIVGLALAMLILPEYNSLFSANLKLVNVLKPMNILGVVISFVLLTLFAGGYPAIVMMQLNTVEVLKGKLKINRKNYFRNGLIVMQFVFSSILICCTLVAWEQLNFLKSKPLGFNKDAVISVPIANLMNGNKLVQLLQDKLQNNSSIKYVSGASNNLGLGKDGSTMTSRVGFRFEEHDVETNWLSASYDYIPTLGIEIIKGRNFNKAYATDSFGIIINEAMWKHLDIKDREPIGLELPINDEGPKMKIVGIMKDYNFQSLHKKIEPLSITLATNNDYIPYAFVQVAGGQYENGMKAVETAWNEILPNQKFYGSFLDENIERQYKREEKLSSIFVSGAILTVIVSCMGLFAISLLVIAQRTKEIGIRKTLGASIMNITVLLSFDFMKLVGLGIVVALPLALYFLDSWLSDFAYHVSIRWWYLLLVALVAIIIALVTVSYQSIRAALMNPVKSLKTE